MTMQSIRTYFIFLLISVLLLASCNTEEEWLVNGSPATKAPQDFAIPPDLLARNVHTTDRTAIVRIIKARRFGGAWLRFGIGGYENHVYAAEILETIKGSPSPKLIYTVMAEATSDLALPGYPIVVSLCEGEEGVYYTPDNGYVSAATDSLIEEARSAVKTASPEALSSGGCAK